MSELIINSHVGEVRKELEDRIPAVMSALGLQAEGNAISEITKLKAVDTGRLRNSITYATSRSQGSPNGQAGERAKSEDYAMHGTPEEGTVYIGTNVEYASYIELGTFKMAPRPFLKNAITNYVNEYKDIIEKGLK